MEQLEYKNLKINPDIKTCFIDGEEVKLTKIEYNLLIFLLSHKNKVFSRGELSLEVWNKKLTGRTVDTTISRLRKKLGDIGTRIVTKLGFGYGFIG